jgi:hypothetical protein
MAPSSARAPADRPGSGGDGHQAAKHQDQPDDDHECTGTIRSRRSIGQRPPSRSALRGGAGSRPSPGGADDAATELIRMIHHSLRTRLPRALRRRHGRPLLHAFLPLAGSIGRPHLPPPDIPRIRVSVASARSNSSHPSNRSGFPFSQLLYRQAAVVSIDRRISICHLLPRLRSFISAATNPRRACRCLLSVFVVGLGRVPPSPVRAFRRDIRSLGLNIDLWRVSRFLPRYTRTFASWEGLHLAVCSASSRARSPTPS